MLLFLQGASKLGKSTLLRQQLAPVAPHIAGLMVQRLLEHGENAGFCARGVRGDLPPVEQPWEDGLDHLFLDHGKYAPEKMELAFSDALHLCKDPACKLIVLDEIGGLELLSDKIVALLMDLLHLGKPCIGVIKSRDNLVQTIARTGAPSAVLTAWSTLHEKIIRHGTIWTMTRENCGETEKRVQQFLLQRLS